mmetsp:Transcript_11350/g.26776  ORF Transcript_11350/g.26776 Transcript_11350/m.26776 type:complete len:205 (-) Transcript_11350:331-945(-)
MLQGILRCSRPGQLQHQAAGAQCRQMPAPLGSRLQFPSVPRTTPPAQSPKRAQLSVPFPPPRLPRRSPNTPALPPHLGLQRPGAPSDLLPRLPQSPAPAPKAPAPRQSARGVDSGKPGRSRVPVPIPWHLRSRARHLPRRRCKPLARRRPPSSRHRRLVPPCLTSMRRPCRWRCSFRPTARHRSRSYLHPPGEAMLVQKSMRCS